MGSHQGRAWAKVIHAHTEGQRGLGAVSQERARGRELLALRFGPWSAALGPSHRSPHRSGGTAQWLTRLQSCPVKEVVGEGRPPGSLDFRTSRGKAGSVVVNAAERVSSVDVGNDVRGL